jgi:hypothetical protein
MAFHDAHEIGDRRFVSTLNTVWDELGLDWGTPPAPADPAAVASWARFLAACAQRGISVGDPRWRRLEVRRKDGRPRFHLPIGPGSGTSSTGKDFRVGLALLVSLLGGDSKSDD